MTLASGADILLDDDEFFIDRSVTEHYKHRFYDLVPQESQIVGAPGKKQLLNDTLMWTYDDWGSGEGNRIYYADEFDKYNVGYELNPRNRGLLTGRPSRTMTTLATNDLDRRPVLTVGDSAIWLGGDDRVHWSTDGTSFTSVSQADTGLNALDAGYFVTAMAGDHEYTYYAGWTSDTGGTRVIMRIRANSTDDAGVILSSEQTGTAPLAGLAVMNSKLYGWTGRRLHEYDDPAQTTMPLSSGERRTVGNTGTDPVSTNLSGNWWADCFATENSIVAFYSTSAQSRVYEWRRRKSLQPFWTAPYGFTIKAGCYQNGVCYFFGHYGGDSSADGWGAAYAVPLDTLRPIFLGYVRRQQSAELTIQECASSYGDQVLFAAGDTGEVLVYDTDQDSITMLDQLYDSSADSLDFDSDVERVGALATFGPLRYAAVYNPSVSGSGNYQLLAWQDDEPNSRQAGLNTTRFSGLLAHFETPIWDFDFPMERKSLIGFHLAFEPLISGQLIDVSYQVENGAFVALTQITSSTSGASAGRVFLPVSVGGSNIKFFQMAYRVKLSSSITEVQPPVLYAVTAECKLVRKREEWQIAVRLKDEPSQNRPSNRQASGATLRDWLEATVEAGSVVTFRDGYRYRSGAAGESRYTSHNVVIKEFEDEIQRTGEGTCRLLLVAATEAT